MGLEPMPKVSLLKRMDRLHMPKGLKHMQLITVHTQKEQVMQQQEIAH